MYELMIILMIILFFVTIVLSSRYFYLLEIKQFTKKIMKVLDVNVLELNYSYEQMVYFYSLPSNIPSLRDATRADISIEYEYESLFFRQLKGIKINVETNKEKVLLAYLSVKDFRFPSLDLLLENGKIDEFSYMKISIYKLIHRKTIQDIIEEVYRQMQLGRYEQISH